jgi:hypothetical protein
MNILISKYPIEIQNDSSIHEEPVCACLSGVNQLFITIPLTNPISFLMLIQSFKPGIVILNNILK